MDSSIKTVAYKRIWVSTTTSSSRFSCLGHVAKLMLDHGIRVGCCVCFVVLCGGGCGLAPVGRVTSRGLKCGCGGVLLSHILSGAVPSPCQALTSGFGMGPGVSPGPWPPQDCRVLHACSVMTGWWIGNRTGTRKEHDPDDCLDAQSVDASAPSSPCREAFPGRKMMFAVAPLVPVGSTARAASTSGLSTTCSPWGVRTPQGVPESLS